MSFFKKLKERLLRSSSKIGEGLDAIVAEGGAAEDAAPETGAPAPSAPEPEAAKPAAAAPRSEPVAEARPAPEPEAPQPVSPEPASPPRPAATAAPPRSAATAAPEAAPPRPAPPAPPKPAPASPGAVPHEAAPPGAAPPESVPHEAAPHKPGLIGRMLGRGEAAPVPRRALDDAMLESIEELLIGADMGVETALRVTANLAEGRIGKRFSTDELKALLAAEIARIMEPVARPLPLFAKRPQVVLVVGVNGSGKTTTIGKLASQFRAAGKKVVIAAGDTFRAAAVEQLQIWGERAGVPVLTAPEGSDPASLAFEAMDRAQRDGADLLLIDTAGRLQNRADLMEELSKIVRVIARKDPEAPHNTLLVLDATTGQNALSQVEIFRKLADVSGLVMTKLDGTAKGGVLVALADRFGLPIHAIGVGEQIDDLAPFDPEEFARALTGADG